MTPAEYRKFFDHTYKLRDLFYCTTFKDGTVSTDLPFRIPAIFTRALSISVCRPSTCRPRKPPSAYMLEQWMTSNWDMVEMIRCTTLLVNCCTPKPLWTAYEGICTWRGMQMMRGRWNACRSTTCTLYQRCVCKRSYSTPTPMLW